MKGVYGSEVYDSLASEIEYMDDSMSKRSIKESLKKYETLYGLIISQAVSEIGYDPMDSRWNAFAPRIVIGAMSTAAKVLEADIAQTIVKFKNSIELFRTSGEDVAVQPKLPENLSIIEVRERLQRAEKVVEAYDAWNQDVEDCDECAGGTRTPCICGGAAFRAALAEYQRHAKGKP